MKKEMVVKNEVKKGFVDLGLSVKWANMNEGAKSVIDSGKYYAWNEVNVDDEGRLPSESEMRELIEKCNWEWVNKDGVNGYMVRSRVNGNGIFLPAAGLVCGEEACFVGEMGYYLSSTVKENPIRVSEVLFSKIYKSIYLAGSYKRSVRLVKD